MRVLLRQKAGGGFNLVSKNGNFPRLMRNKVQGLGISEDFYDKKDKTNKVISNISKDFESLKIKPKKSKKYITLNI